MVKENGMVMMTQEEFNRICKCYEKNIADQKDEHEYETDLICKDYERTIDTLKQEHREDVANYEKRLELMQKALLELTHNVDTIPHDKRISKADFVAMHSAAVRDMDGLEDNDIYGYDVTVHWHGIYCNCGDGAVAANNIVPGIEGVMDEDPTEYD